MRWISHVSSFNQDESSSVCKTDADRCTFDFGFEQYDMACSDSDGIWANSPWLFDSVTSHVRMVNDDS